MTTAQQEVAVIEQGVFPDMPMNEYLALPALSSGLCHTILSASPLHAWTESWLSPNRKREDSSVMDIGTYAHALLLERGTDALVVIEADDWRTKAAKEKRDQAHAEGKLPILAHKVEEVETMVREARGFINGDATHDPSEIAGVFGRGKPELTITWTEGDAPCKIRPDWLTDDRSILLHYKTTKVSVQPESFSRTAINMGYDVAMAFYARPFWAGTHHLILAQEQTAPYACKIFGLSNAQSEIAIRKVERALNTWAACMKSGRWPAYDGRVHYIEPTPWQMEQALQNGDIDGLGYDAEIAGEGVQA